MIAWALAVYEDLCQVIVLASALALDELSSP